jgi:molybdopterin converting factor small subunit
VTPRTRVRVLTFAGLAEALGSREVDLDLPAGSRVRDAWRAIVVRAPAVGALEASTRAALSGRIVGFDEALGDGDEVAFLPPVGGG